MNFKLISVVLGILALFILKVTVQSDGRDIASANASELTSFVK